MKRIIPFLLPLILFTSAQAQLGSHAVVLVHGFNPADLSSNPDADTVTANGAYYWSDFWLNYADARIDWPSHERIKEKISADYAWPVLKQLSENNTCQVGCVFVTHSTGDLLTRYLIDNQANWLENAGLAPLNIIATLDFSGAGGGSELADVAAASGSSALVSSMVNTWLGFTPTSDNLGVMNDLMINNARDISPEPGDRVPRLRFAGNSSSYLNVTSGFLPGGDDGVVSAHSSCGAQVAGSYTSCSTQYKFNGKIAQNNGVQQFMPDHYPVIMGSDYNHGATIQAGTHGYMTAVNKDVTLGDDSQFNLDTYIYDGWFADYSYIKNSHRTSMSQLVADTVQ